jgi:hypothetical protein
MQYWQPPPPIPTPCPAQTAFIGSSTVVDRVLCMVSTLPSFGVIPSSFVGRAYVIEAVEDAIADCLSF